MCGLPAKLAEHMVGQEEEPLTKRPRIEEETPVNGLKVDGWLILGVDTLSFCTRDSNRGERRPDVHIQLRAPDTTFVVDNKHTLTVSTCYLFVAPDVESKCQWVKCLGKAIAGETQTAPCTSRELKAVTVVPLKSSADSLNISVTSSMLDDSVV
ncbi:hypothetical protein EMCRGX_G024701 [Ephydatia muelleri]